MGPRVWMRPSVGRVAACGWSWRQDEVAEFWALACCHELWERPAESTGLHLEMAGVTGVIGDGSSSVTRLSCIPPAAHWDPGLPPVPGKWGESRPAWEGWETLVSAGNLEKLKKPD